MSFAIYMALVVACLMACAVNKRFFRETYLYFLLLLSSVLLFESGGLLWPEKAQNVLNHVYQPVEFTLLTLIYKTILKNHFISRHWKKIVWGFVVVSLSLSVFVEGLTAPNTLSFLMGSVLVIIYALLYVYELYAYPPQYDGLFSNPYFWINTGHLFFYCGTFFQMGLDAYLMGIDIEVAMQLRIIIKALNYTLYTLYLTGFICRTVFPSSL